ncbi:MAG: TrkH family potassium uptake protein [Bacteroidaceae bacterium]|nr:TrkH family potassium uptake protein [Bacteroidaceae bacterium]
MINWRVISKILGQLLFLEVLFLVLCLGVSLFYCESDTVPFAISCGITTVAALILCLLGFHGKNTMNRRDSYLVVSLSWVMYSLFGALPFLIGGYISSPIDAFFETMSGFTTTGASIIDDVEVLPHALLFWRSMTQWIGGLGIVFFTIAVIPSMVGGSVKVFTAEATGPTKIRLHSRLSTTGKWIWGIYIFLTIVCALAFYVEGMCKSDAVNYAMTVMATGGFATHNASTGFFHSVAIDYTAILFMFLSGTSYSLLYVTIFKRRFSALVHNLEFRFYLRLIIIATIAIMALLMMRADYDFWDALRSGLFQVVSFTTTTGVFNDDAGQWPHITWVILTLCMIIGGCAGSTSGGFKSIRAVMALQIMRNEIHRLLHPNAVLPVKSNENAVPINHQMTLMAFFAISMTMCFITYFIMILMGVDSTNSITIAISCVSNVGPTLGLEIGPTMSWSILPEFVKLLLCPLMLMGRLEILSVLVLFSRSFWHDK